MPRAEGFVTGLVLAAGGSSRLGRPKQLLPLGGTTLLGHVLGGAAERVQPAVDFTGVQVVENPSFGAGCSSSIAAAMDSLDARASVLVLMLGDQPGVRASAVESLLAGRAGAPLAACAYSDGRGHPLAFARTTFDELRSLHGDKAVWKLIDRYGEAVADIPVVGRIPRDVDTWEDYEAVRAAFADAAGATAPR
jgi:molybdenum cofactor cytidylyltransferase